MVIAPGSTSVSLDVLFVDDTGLPITNLTYLTAPAIYYIRPREAEVQIPLVSIASVTVPWTAGGFRKRFDGWYRLDMPDSAWASAGTVKLMGDGTNQNLLHEQIEVRALTGDHVRIVEPFPAGHKVIVQGDSYLYADGNPITITKQDGASWPSDLSAGSPTLTMTLRRITSKPVQADGSPSTASSLALSGGAVVVATGDSQQVRFDATAVQTASLAAGQGVYQYDVQWASSTSRRTLERGVVTVLRQETTA